MKNKLITAFLFSICIAVLVNAVLSCKDKDLSPDDDDDDTTYDNYQDIALSNTISKVQPMTGIVLWEDNAAWNNTDMIQLEYFYAGYNEVVDTSPGVYDWSSIDNRLTAIAARSHQAILRFYYTYPGQPTTVPQYIKDLPSYIETNALSEGQMTGFPDWTSDDLKAFTMDFYHKLAQRYEDDARLAFLQTGFGLWGEYHIYDGPNTVGVNFPDMAFQEAFVTNMDAAFDKIPWSISIDAADSYYSPFSAVTSLLNYKFGLFDDSFLQINHATENAANWNFFGFTRYQDSPAGGEFNYYTAYDQSNALSPTGPHGISFESMGSTFHISYMIGNDQPDYVSMNRIEEAGLACGYKYEIVLFQASPTASRVQVRNIGIAPIYYDAWVTVNGVRSTASLIDLMPGQTTQYDIASGGSSPVLTIECDRLVTGQEIQYQACLGMSCASSSSSSSSAGSVWLNGGSFQMDPVIPTGAWGNENDSGTITSTWLAGEGQTAGCISNYFSGLSAWDTCGLGTSLPINNTPFTGIQFYVKGGSSGDGLMLVAYCPDATAASENVWAWVQEPWSWPKNSWTLVQVPFSAMTYPSGWGLPANSRSGPWDGINTMGGSDIWLTFLYQGIVSSSGSFLIDDISYY